MRLLWITPVAAMLILSGCIRIPLPEDTKQSPTSTMEAQIACERRYNRVREGCCLDENGNGACDTDETTTTSLPQSAETTSSTVTQAAVTTTFPQASTTTTTEALLTTTSTTVIRCYSSEECGGNKSSVKCYKDGVYLFEEFPYCKNPGSPDSVCMARQKVQVVDKCDKNEVCMSAMCIEFYSSTCRVACRSEGFNTYYCYVNVSCMPGHSHTPYGDGNCTSDAPYCCCYTVMVTPESSTTTLA